MALKAVPGSFSGAMKSLEYAISKGAKVSSNSYGGKSTFSGFKNVPLWALDFLPFTHHKLV